MQLRGKLDSTYNQACLYLTYKRGTYSFKNFNIGQSMACQTLQYLICPIHIV